MFRCIPLFRGCNRQVEYIDKRHCSLPNVPDDVLRYARSLEELLLDANHIRDLPRGLFRLTKLRRLSVSDNEICRIPPDIANLMNLVEIDVSKNDIPEVPGNIKFLKSLQIADFSSNPLSKLPPEFVQLRNLTMLGLNDVSLTQLPADFGSLTNLQSVELRENLLKTLPASFAFLVKLERLDLGSNEIEDLPPLVGHLTSLQELWLDCNELTTLPKEIGNCKKLACLDISENRVECLPEEISGLESLTDLHLSQNAIETLPEGIGHLRKLTIFKVDQNRLLTLTAAIGNCVNLQELILTENLLTELPESIGNMVKLTNLNVDRNSLTDLPPQIGNLVRLGVLSLRDNHVSYLPLEMGKLKELHVMDVSGNRLQHLPITITALNLKALWLAENQSQPMLKFQTDIDQRTGMKVLTCFLLPQLEYHPDSMENLLRDSTDQDSRLSWDNKAAERISAVKFAEDSEEDKEDKDSAQFVRHDTPHPRELKARHQKLFNQKGKPIDDDQVHQNELVVKENGVTESFRPQRTSTASTESSSSSSDASANHVEQDGRNSVSTYEEEPGINRPRGGEHHMSSAESKGETIDESSMDVSHDSRDGAAKGTNAASSSSSSSEEEEEEDDEQEENESDSANESSVHSKEGAKHVGFISGGEEAEQPEKHNRLHRRDTPHHLKNKRVHLLNSKEAQEKVATILAQALKKDDEGLPPPPPSPPRSNSALHRSMESRNSNVISDESSSNLIETIEERIEVCLERKSSGLGLSIAGGKGSTPYKGNDEGIFISRITEGGPSDVAGLRIGDKLVHVNGVNVAEVDHYEAVNVLKASGEKLILVVMREVPLTRSTSRMNDHEIVPEATVDFKPKTEVRSVPIPRSPTPTSLVIEHNSVSSKSQPSSRPPSSPRVAHFSEPLTVNVNQQRIVESVVKDEQNSFENHLPNKMTTPTSSNIQIQTETVNSLTPDVSIEYERRLEILYSTLIRDQHGLGFSIAGGRGGTPYKEDNDGIYISRIAEGGSADKDGKVKVGDQILSINGIDIDDARHDQVINMLTGLERYVRLVIQREQLVPIDPNAPKSSEKSPKLFGLPKPYGGIYSSGSYMANRPSYLGSYKRPDIVPVVNTTANTTSAHSTSFEKPMYSIYTKLPGLRNDPIPIHQQQQQNASLASSTAVTYNHPNSVVTSIAAGGCTTPASNGVFSNSSHPSLSTFKIDPKHSSASLHNNNNSVIQTVNTSGSMTRNSVGPPPLSSSTDVVSTSGPRRGPLVTVTIQQPEPYVPLGSDLPAAPTGMGKVTESITKSTFTETTTTRLTHNAHSFKTPYEEDITLVKAGGPLGLSIIGGSNHSCHPFGGDEPGIFISKIVSDGAAANTEKLKVGDRLLMVNGENISNATHQDAVLSLLAPTYEMTLRIRHDPLPKGWQEFVIYKSPSEKLGMNIKGGARGHPGNPLNKEDEGVFISRINPDGAVARDGRLRTGMRIVEVNGVSLLGASHQEAVNGLRNSGDIISLLVCDGYDPADIDSLVCIDSPKNSNSQMTSGISSSSLDREDEGTAAVRQEQEVLKETAEWEKEDFEKVEKQRKERAFDDQLLFNSEDKSVSKVHNESPKLSRAVVVHGSNKSVDQKVLDVVRAAEQLVKPVIQTANNSLTLEPLNANREQKTTTIILSKHIVEPPQTSTPLSNRRSSHFGYSSPTLTPNDTPMHMTGDTELDLSSDSLLDPIGQSRLPAAKPPFYKNKKGLADELNNSQPERLTFSEKKKRFEQAMQPSPINLPNNEQKRFSFFSDDELEKMKEEEERKMASMTEEELKSFRSIREDEDEDEHHHHHHVEEIRQLGVMEERKLLNRSVSPRPNQSSQGQIRPNSFHGNLSNIPVPVRTAKAEKRQQEKQKMDIIGGSAEELDSFSELTPAQARSLKAEKRAAWRQARLKSLEEDAMKAQIVITKEQELKEAMERKPAAQRLSTVDIDIDIDGIIEEEPFIVNESNERLSDNSPDDPSDEFSIETTTEKIVSLEFSDVKVPKNGFEGIYSENNNNTNNSEEAAELATQLAPQSPLTDNPSTNSGSDSTSLNRKKKKKKSKRK